MKKIITSFLFLAAGIISFAQTANDDYYNASKKPNFLSKERITASVTAGSAVCFYGSTKGPSFTSFIAPKISYQLTQKFKLNAGVMHYTSSPNNAFIMNRNEAIVNTGNKSISGNLIFAGGEYQLNKKVILSGEMIVNASELKQNGYKAAAIGIDYKISEHSSIGFKASVSEGQKNYINTVNPLSPSGFNSFGSGFANDNTMFRQQ